MDPVWAGLIPDGTWGDVYLPRRVPVEGRGLLKGTVPHGGVYMLKHSVCRLKTACTAKRGSC